MGEWREGGDVEGQERGGCETWKRTQGLWEPESGGKGCRVEKTGNALCGSSHLALVPRK